MSPLDYAAQICYSSREVLQFTYDAAVRYKNYPGVYVEAGVAAGAQIIAMAAGAPDKTIYAFDSFEGIPLPSNRDDQMPGIKFLSKEEQSVLPGPGKQELKSSGATSTSVDVFWEHVVKSGAYTHGIGTVRGWFEETVPRWCEMYPEEQIAILRLDGDLYNSTYVCLKYLYPKVIKGGLVIVDDIQLPGCKQAVDDYFKDTNQILPGRTWIDGTVYWYKAPNPLNIYK